MVMGYQVDAYALLRRVREAGPVVHHITNVVTVYDCAQIVKCLGASPVMAFAPEEVADMAALASALVLNIGTLNEADVAAMKLAAQAAAAKGIPVVLDVCGAGATPYRDACVTALLAECRICIIKGNASEIARVAGATVQTKGVDSGAVEDDVAALAATLAMAQQATVVVTGPVDIVTDGARVLRISNGDALMAAVVGTGCMATSVIGAFAAVEKDAVMAAAGALSAYEIAAELAAQQARGPMAFKAALFDQLYALDGAVLTARQKIAS